MNKSNIFGRRCSYCCGYFKKAETKVIVQEIIYECKNCFDLLQNSREVCYG